MQMNPLEKLQWGASHPQQFGPKLGLHFNGILC